MNVHRQKDNKICTSTVAFTILYIKVSGSEMYQLSNSGPPKGS